MVKAEIQFNAISTARYSVKAYHTLRKKHIEFLTIWKIRCRKLLTIIDYPLETQHKIDTA
jgi:hypothetical protein